MASLQVASPQVEEEVCGNAEELQTTVMTPTLDIYDIDKPVHLIDDDIEEEEEDIEIIPQRDQGKQVEDLDDATDEEEEVDVNGVKPDEPANKGIRTRRFPDQEDDDE